jgi:hypothetical protein
MENLSCQKCTHLIQRLFIKEYQLNSADYQGEVLEKEAERIKQTIQKLGA